MKTSQKILITKRNLFSVLIITMLFGACHKDDTFFNQIQKDEEIREEVVDTIYEEQAPNTLEIESYKVSQKPQRGASKDTESEFKEEDIIVCQIIVEFFKEEDIALLETKYQTKNLSIIKSLFSTTILLCHVELSIEDNADEFLAQLQQDELVRAAEWNKKLKRRNH